MQLTSNEMCFACGNKNPVGLKLNFTPDGDELITELKIEKNYQGWDGIAHGGILATALDEVMAWILINKGHRAITAKLEVRYIKPVNVGEKIILRSRIIKERGKYFETAAEAELSDGVIVAEAKAVSLRV